MCLKFYSMTFLQLLVILLKVPLLISLDVLMEKCTTDSFTVKVQAQCLAYVLCICTICINTNHVL